jgi:adenylosuccinate lyase
VALAMREKGAATNDLLDRLAADERLRLSRPELDELVTDVAAFTGLASTHVRSVADRVATVVAAHPQAAAFTSPPIL